MSNCSSSCPWLWCPSRLELLTFPSRLGGCCSLCLPGRQEDFQEDTDGKKQKEKNKRPSVAGSSVLFPAWYSKFSPPRAAGPALEREGFFCHPRWEVDFEAPLGHWSISTAEHPSLLRNGLPAEATDPGQVPSGDGGVPAPFHVLLVPA